MTPLTFGAMQLSDVTEDQAISTVHKAMELGINHFETARGYGSSEVILGRGLKGFDRSKMIVTTKITPKHHKTYTKYIEESLTRLQLEYIDNFDIHGINTVEQYGLTLMRGGALDAVKKAASEGLIRSIGFSSHGPLELILRLIETREFESVNLHYYYFNQRNLPALKRASELDMGVLIISPTDKGGRLQDPPPLLCELTNPYHPITINHRFCLSHPEVTTVTVGASHPDEFGPHLAALYIDGPLVPTEREIIEKLNMQYNKLGKTYCTYCHKCLPCPEKINIPEVLRLRNLAIAFDMVGFGRYRYKMFENADHWFPGKKASHCTRCNECIPRCPEKLDIPNLLFETHKMLSGERGKRKWKD